MITSKTTNSWLTYDIHELTFLAEELRIPRLRSCGFESRPGNHFKNSSLPPETRKPGTSPVFHVDGW